MNFIEAGPPAEPGSDAPAVVTLLTGNRTINEAIKEFCVNDRQKSLWAKPGVNVVAYANRVDPNKVKVRPSYLNAVLIQSRGGPGEACHDCVRHPTRGPFTECRRVRGHFGGACGNCKWRDHGARCSTHNPYEESDGETGQLEAGPSEIVEEEEE